MQSADEVAAVLRDAAEIMLQSPHRTGSSVLLPARGRLLVTGDLHDNPMHLNTITRLAKLNKSPDHHVILQEMIHGERLINGMDFSHRMLIRAAHLVTQYPEQVHPLLANHELSQLTGKGVSKGAGNNVDLFNNALEYVFGDAMDEVHRAITDFIRAMPIALRSEGDGGGVFCAHSLPAEAMMKYFDPAILERETTDADYTKPHGSAYLLVWGRHFTDEQLDQLSASWNVKLFCLGHEHVEMGIKNRGSRVLVLNSDHELGAALPLELANLPDAEEALMYSIPLRAVSNLEEM